MGSGLTNGTGTLGNPDTLTDIAIQTGSKAILPAGFLVGHAQNETAGTGCTTIICEQGAIGGVSVRGAAPATRETDLLNPCNTVERVNGIVLSGGSAFGLDAAGGAMRWLSEHKAGFCVAETVVPIVCSACLFDLNVGDGGVCPDAAFGYAACEAASTTVATGNVGAGTGASVGKLLGEQLSMKGGFGAASICLEELTVTALVVVNALGTIYDRSTTMALAGTRDPQTKTTLLDPIQAALMMLGTGMNPESSQNSERLKTAPANTTIGCLLTNGILTKAQMTRIADCAHDGYARAIDPVHTGFDGDAIFALTTATIPTIPDLVGMLGAVAMEKAIHNAVLSATGAYRLPSASDLKVNHKQKGS
ncbi:MAG: P1 family peptidase [Coriobacteriales bacterium]|jgi:L-aminopeptidase/D-esterase-like protein|nr:P1 family peptidase [Coriobacteriales bacterium]